MLVQVKPCYRLGSPRPELPTPTLGGSSTPDFPTFPQWLRTVSPELTWDWPHLQYVRRHLLDVTEGRVDRLAVSWPPQHAKTWSTTVRYPLWRMLREPGLRVGVGCYNQIYANKVSGWVRRLARRIGLTFADSKRIDEWELSNGSTFIARGVGGGIAGQPLDLFVIDDPFKNREEADSSVIQERVHEWYMDDVTPRIQEQGALIIIHARWNPGDLIGRIKRSEEGEDWQYISLQAIAGDADPIGRNPGEPLCPARFSLAKLEQKRKTEGVGFESLYQQNEIPRGGSFFERQWFEQVSYVPDREDGTPPSRLRYWDLGGAKKETSAWTSGVLMADNGRYKYVEDVIRVRLAPGERNQLIRDTARSDMKRPGFRKTYFEQQPAVAGLETTENLVRTMAGLPVEGDKVTGDKVVRAEPLADSARVGLVKVVAANWNGAFLGEIEAFPNGPWKDQTDSASGAFNKHASLPAGSPGATQYARHPETVRPNTQLYRDYASEAGLFGMGGTS